MSGECESAITKTGWGLCNFSVITLCGICMIAEAGASIIILIVSPLLNCDLKFESNSVTEMNATVSLGMAFGGFTFGTLVDMNGRKESIPVAMIVIFCGSIGLAFAHTYFLVNLMIFVLGIGVAGTNLIFRIYMIECLPARKRGSCLAVLDFCWIAGYVIFLGICGAMTPSAIELQGNDFRPISWRVMSGLGAAPILVMACAMSLLPPSPRFLLYKRHPEQAISVLRQMFAINFSRHADKYPVTIRSLEGCIEVDEDEEPNANKSIRKLIHKYLSKSLKRMKKILTPPCLRVTILCILACCFHFPGFIWVALWNTHILKETRNNTGSIVWKSNFTCISDSESMALAFLNNNCTQANNAYFLSFLLCSLSFAVGEIILIIAIDIIGRRLFLILSGLIGSTALVAFTFTTRHVTRNVLSICFLSSFAISYTTVTIIILENYPTGLRGTIMGFSRILPHLVGYFMKILMKLPCLPTLYIASGIMIGATIAAIPLPDLTKAPMKE
ncbi:putative transporter SVOPL isoform X1 [Belonocnema kinseyi]|uniref:putative transporter SVOPL isoform X1 n=1 Tax=Belonocnema kinseyi TaxID=2817044 RepID=UPI00143DB8CF|nr:putative transporter SVOPL isoform X1 [Belonocnema kinseyi]